MSPAPTTPGWARQAWLYQVNLRQHTPEGTIQAFARDLPRLAGMGVGMLWLMPVHPIGQLHRKGGLGSPYSVRDHQAVDPALGSLGDLRQLVQQAHALGLRLILDWVANHTAWDHAWTQAHPDWYLRDAQGALFSCTYRASPEAEPEYWTDVVGLDWRQPALWPAMTEAMRYWRREVGVDGFRCDVASLVPAAFWAQARAALQADGPLFMLAEGEDPALHSQAGFDATYDLALFGLLQRLARGQAGSADLHAWWADRQQRYPAQALGLNYTANHDSNAWVGHCEQLFGSRAALQAMAVLAATLPGLPLLYGGQESFLRQRLPFFEREALAWGTRELQPFYTDLMALKRQHPALHGSTLVFDSAPGDTVVRFRRLAGDTALRVAVNLSAQPAPGLPGWGWQIGPDLAESRA